MGAMGFVWVFRVGSAALALGVEREWVREGDREVWRWMMGVDVMVRSSLFLFAEGYTPSPLILFSSLTKNVVLWPESG